MTSNYVNMSIKGSEMLEKLSTLICVIFCPAERATKSREVDLSRLNEIKVFICFSRQK